MRYLSRFIICNSSQTKQKYKNHNKLIEKQTKDVINVKITTNQVTNKLSENLETITNQARNKL